MNGFVDNLVASGVSRQDAEKQVSPERSITPPVLSGIAQDYIFTFKQLSQKRTYTIMSGMDSAKAFPNPLSYSEIYYYSKLLKIDFESIDIEILNYCDWLDMRDKG